MMYFVNLQVLEQEVSGAVTLMKIKQYFHSLHVTPHV